MRRKLSLASFAEGCLEEDLESHRICLLLEILEDGGQITLYGVIFPALGIEVHEAFRNMAIIAMA